MNSFVIFARRVAFSLLLAAAAPVIAGGLSLTIADPAAAAVASSVTVKGNQRIEAETIKTYIAIKPGKAYGPADIDASIKTLFDTGLFADCLAAVRQPGKAVKRRLDYLRSNAQCAHGCIGCTGILMIVRARKAHDFAQINRSHLLAPPPF